MYLTHACAHTHICIHKFELKNLNFIESQKKKVFNCFDLFGVCDMSYPLKLLHVRFSP